MVRFTFPYSHAFKGSQLTVNDEGPPGPACLIEFADGTTVVGEVARPDDDSYLLMVPAYETAKGAPVKARTWLVTKRSGESAWRATPTSSKTGNDRLA